MNLLVSRNNNQKVSNELKNKKNKKNKKIKLLESTTSLHQNALEQLELTCDDNQQYSRRSCLRIHGIEFNSNEDSDIVMNKTGKSYGDMALEFDESEID